MSILKSPQAKTLLLFGSLILTSNLVGCGSGNPNEKEYFAHTQLGAAGPDAKRTKAGRSRRSTQRGSGQEGGREQESPLSSTGILTRDKQKV
jgi:hypothetical protein